MKYKLVPAVILLSAALGWQATQPASKINKDENGIAVGGYDLVSFFEAKPVKGHDARMVEHEGAKYLFATDEHRRLFSENPNRYLPEYGGWCAFGMAKGYKAKVDPLAYTVVNGKLYLNYNPDVSKSWNANKEELIPKADAAWKKMDN